MRRPLILALGLLLLATPSTAADEMVTAGDVTERGRGLARILDMILVPAEAPPPEGRAVVLFLDVTDSLLKSGFPGELEQALERNARALAGTRIGVGRVGAVGRLRLRPTEDRSLLLQNVRDVCRTPDRSFQNVYAEIRRILPELRREKGVRELALITLENGDAEDDVEATATALGRADVCCSVVSREAFLSDTMWSLNPPRGPRGTTFTGSDNAFVDVPWGWRFQWGIANSFTLSGYAMYGLTRLAAATNGRVYLYYPPSGTTHACRLHPYVICPFCSGDHDPQGDVYQSQRLRASSPPAASRREILAHAAKDPYYRAVQQAWEEASRHHLVYSLPSLQRTPGGVKVERRTYRGWTPLGTTASFDSEGARAQKLIRACDEILGELEKDLERAEAQGGHERYRAIAETTELLLRITGFNLRQYVAFCRDTGRKTAARRPADHEPPEVDVYGKKPRFVGIGFRSLSLCHGVAPFRWVRLPGGEDAALELAELRRRWDTFETRWAHTPWLRAARGTGLARFWLVFEPGYTPPGERRVQDEPEDDVVTLPERPARPTRPNRPGTGRSSGGGGPISGGD